MTEEKRKRMAAASTISTVLLIALLIVVIVYQLVVIAVVRAQAREISGEIARLEQEIKNSENDRDYLQSDEYLRWKAYEQGYRDR